jgi:enoyl reductase-like protein
MTMVGTVNMNKPESAAPFLNGKQILFFYFCCTSDLTPLSYIPARNKTVILFSRQHHDDMCMGEEQDHKLGIIMHSNDNYKRGF